jgi:hypothetical protein
MGEFHINVFNQDILPAIYFLFPQFMIGNQQLKKHSVLRIYFFYQSITYLAFSGKPGLGPVILLNSAL